MRKIVLFLYLASFIWADGTDAKKPYEATWLEIFKKSDGSYEVLNYPSVLDCGKTRSPFINRVRGDSMTWIVPWEEPSVFKDFDEIVKLSDSSYEFNPKDWNKRSSFKFDYIDKANHIAQWSIYYNSGKLQNAYMFIDSLYNTFPIVDPIWEEEEEEDCKANLP